MKKLFITSLLVSLSLGLLATASAAPAPEGFSVQISEKSNADPEYGLSMGALLGGTMQAKYGSAKINHADFNSFEFNYYQALPVVDDFSVSLGTRRLEYNNDSTWKMQVGVQKKFKLTEKTSAYTNVYWSKNFLDQDLGLAYELTSNLELNVGYYNTKTDNIGGSSPRSEGVSVGATFKL